MSRDAGTPRVLALHLPDLPLERLQRTRNPGTEPHRPVAIVSDGQVVCRDADAAAAGVEPGDTLGEALGACGRLAAFPAEPAADRAALRALAEALLVLAPAVEVAPPDVLLLDASAAHLLGSRLTAPGEEERVLAERAVALAAELGYRASAAVASGRGPARALARHAGGTIVRAAPAETARALAPLPLGALGLPPDVAARLRALGVADVGALARLPAEALAHRFGAAGVAAARLARGDDRTPLVPYVPEALPEEGIELDGPAESAEPLLFALKRLADRVAARLAGRALGASRLKLVLKLDPRGEERVMVPLAHPTAAAARWLTPLKEHLFSLRLPAAVIGVALAAVEVAPTPPEQLAIGDRPEALAALETVLARLSVRLGDGALFAAEEVERYRPEGAYRPVPFRPGTGRSRRARDEEVAPELPLDAGRSDAPDVAGGTVPVAATADLEQTSREGLAAVTPIRPALAPVDPVVRGRRVGGAPAPLRARPTRLLAAPEPVVAEGEGGRLTAIRVAGRDRAVLAFEGPERLRGEWWSAAFDRDYYRVRLEALGDCWVYRDAADGRLYLHGFFD